MRRQRRWVWWLAAVVAIAAAVLLGIGVRQWRSWRLQRDVDEYMRSGRYLARIARDNPTLEAPIRQMLVKAIASGHIEEATSEAAPILGAVFPKYMAHASDVAALRLGRNLATMLDRIAEHDRNLCYLFLFPKPSEPVLSPIRVYAPTDFLPSLQAMVESALDAPQVAPTLANVRPQAVVVFARLDKRFGADAALLDEPDSPTVDREKACLVTKGLYEEVVALPDAQAGPLLRYLFSRAEAGGAKM